eukprot:3382445-Prymnesium_polylepis.1
MPSWERADYMGDAADTGLARARERQRVPASMHERLHEPTAVQDGVGGRARRARVACACGQARPSDADMRALVEELYKQADAVHMHSGWRVGDAGTGVTQGEAMADEE